MFILYDTVMTSEWHLRSLITWLNKIYKSCLSYFNDNFEVFINLYLYQFFKGSYETHGILSTSLFNTLRTCLVYTLLLGSVMVKWAWSIFESNYGHWNWWFNIAHTTIMQEVDRNVATYYQHANKDLPNCSTCGLPTNIGSLNYII